MGDEGAIRARGKGVVKALKTIATATSRPVRIETKDDRIRTQKLVYLLKAGGYAPAQKFDFNLYQNGPYSPDLTQVYFLYGDNGIAEASPASDIGHELLQAIVEADRHGVVFLEGLATAIDTTTSVRRSGTGGSELQRGLSWAQSIKPHIDADTWREVRGFLRTHPSIAGTT